ncbi:MAG: 3-dehydroquinate synthase [Nitrospinota bacterium]
MRTCQLSLNTPSGSYKVRIGKDLLAASSLKLISRFSNQFLLVTNRKVKNLIGNDFLNSARANNIQIKSVLIRDGEEHKNFSSLAKIHDRLINAKYDRNAVLITLGGGIIGDIGGFAAATFMRSIRYINIPTTLLSQVDSSIGGKTGINHLKGKNLIGAFHQPSLVLSDLTVLNTLAKDEILSGLAEVIKYGLISDRKLFAYLEENIKNILALSLTELAYIVKRSVITKGEIVALDEKEKGIRAILNFGHTVGHAIESLTSYKKYKHGIAVAIGIAVEARLAMIKKVLSEKDLQRIIALLDEAGLPTRIPHSLTENGLINAMKHDKKVLNKNFRFALIKKIGSSYIDESSTLNEIKTAIRLSR